MTYQRVMHVLIFCKLALKMGDFPALCLHIVFFVLPIESFFSELGLCFVDRDWG